MRNKGILFSLVLTAFLISGNAAAETAAWTEEGIASWYGAEFQGRPTSNGEIFNPANLTAAHKSLPFGTLVRVTSPQTGREVVVRINDRGPFVAGRIIDLSQAAAQRLGMGVAGTVPVRLSLAGAGEAEPAAIAAAQPAATVAPAATPWRTVQIASFSSQANARSLLDSLALQGVAAAIETAADLAVYRVVVAKVEAGAVDQLVEKLRALGYPKVLVRR